MSPTAFIALALFIAIVVACAFVGFACLVVGGGDPVSEDFIHRGDE